MGPGPICGNYVACQPALGSLIPVRLLHFNGWCGKRLMKPNYWLATSSLFLMMPAWAAWKCGDTIRIWYHTGVTVVSVTYHLTKHPVVFWIDFVTANSMVPSILPLVSQRDYTMFTYACGVGYCFFMFYYGYIKKDLVWNPDVDQATPYHVSLHYVASMACALALLITNSALTTNSSLTLEHSRTLMSRLEVDASP